MRARGAGSGRAERGLTLIELLIALLVVGGLMALVVPSIQAVTGVHAREEAGRLAGTVGYLYAHSAITGRTCRLTFEVAGDDGEETGGYAAECTEGSPRLSEEPTDVRDGRIDPGFTRPIEEAPTREDEQVEYQVKKGAEWAEFQGRDMKPVKMPPSVRIAGFWTPRLRDVVTGGEAHLFFFPLGETQAAYIWLQDSGDNWYTLTVEPLTGKVKIHPENLEVPLD